MANGVAIFPLSNSVAFSPSPNNGLTVLRQAPYADAIQDWQTTLPYVQKVVNTDQLNITIWTQIDSGPEADQRTSLYICDHNKVKIAAIDLRTAPYYKDFQSAIDWVDPVTGATYSLRVSMWSFSFNDFVADIPDGGIYYLRCDNQVLAGPLLTYYSEPMLVSNTHPDTLLFQFTYGTNNAAKNVIISNWYNNFPTDTERYGPVFSIRAEGYVIPSMTGPKGINIGYFQQSYNPVQIKTQQKRFFDLHLGDISIGVPWYMLEMVTEALLADNVAIKLAGDSNAYPYILYNTGGGDSLADVWKVKGSDVSPLLYASCNVMQRSDGQAAFVTPTPVPIGGRVFDGVFDAVFA